jgi:uncharacterized protein YecE (DUF72 family)
MAEIHVGTSAFTAAGWEETFYPKNLTPADFLSYYATKFGTVELDNTFYRTPSISTVQGWNAKTPPGFIFAAKIPQVITHEKVLLDCEDDLNRHFQFPHARNETLLRPLNPGRLLRFRCDFQP